MSTKIVLKNNQKFFFHAVLYIFQIAYCVAAEFVVQMIHVLPNLSVQPVLGVSRRSVVRCGRHHKSFVWNSNS